eukprot:363295-Chlamydomonas_euryale.AAC.6
MPQSFPICPLATVHQTFPIRPLAALFHSRSSSAVRSASLTACYEQATFWHTKALPRSRSLTS